MRIVHRTVMAGLFPVFVLFVSVSVAGGQEGATLRTRFTNQDVIEMAKLGLSDEVIIAKIRETYAAGADTVSFDTSVDGLKSLKAANVPDSVIKVMINPAPPPPAVVAGTSAISVDPNLPPPEVGVYWRDQGKFVLVQGQAVTNTKTGGKAGSLFTNGLRNQHWDATIAGQTSKNVVRDRQPIFYLYVPDGDDSSDYLLIKLNRKSDHREFQIGSFGGITGGKSGVQKDKEIPFRAEHIGIRMYKITLADQALKPGEYAFFMGTGQSNTMAGAHGGNRSGGSASGRVWDFTIPE
ncbi:MAG: hypothetical protein WBQ68_11885 [Terriglobales bacterium]